MISARKNGRSVNAMVLNRVADRCRGVVQCALAGCQAMQALRGSHAEATAQIAEFLETHDCKST